MEILPEYTSKRDEGVKILVNSNIIDLDSEGMSLSAKAGAARPQEGGRHAVSKFRRAVRVKITIEDRKKSNMAEEFKRKKIVSERKKTDETKSLRLHSVQESCMCEPHTHVTLTPYEGGQGPCIWTSTVRGRETGGDDTERPTSNKMF